LLAAVDVIVNPAQDADCQRGFIQADCHLGTRESGFSQSPNFQRGDRDGRFGRAEAGIEGDRLVSETPP
jgi:hypothetical protein